jgi:hypothetical protein
MSDDALLAMRNSESAQPLREALRSVVILPNYTLFMPHLFKVATSPSVTNKTPMKVSDDFLKQFVGDGRNAYPAVQQPVRAWELNRHLQTAAIIKFFNGDEHKYVTTTADLWRLLNLQPKGEQGLLLTNGDANMFFMRTPSGDLWPITARWRGSWHIDTPGDDGQGHWSKNRLIITRV